MSSKEENKKLIEEFPFLAPVDKENYDYSYTWLDSMPEGWRKAFGLKICKEIKEELIKFNALDSYEIVEIKEKFGGLRWYDGGIPKDSKIFDIVNKYENLSYNICIECGKPAEWESNGWISPFCTECAQKMLDKDNKYYSKLAASKNEEFKPILLEDRFNKIPLKETEKTFGVLTAEELREIFEENFTVC